MTEPKHTPGWSYKPGAVYDEIMRADGTTVCDWDHRGRSYSPNDVDARLIAAAPETAEQRDRLLEALTEILTNTPVFKCRQYHTLQVCPEALREARAAITAATKE